MPRFMLDTNICIHAIKRDEPEVVRRLERTRPRDVAISSVVAAELWTGVIKSAQRQRNEQALKEFLAFVNVLDWPADAARIYGEIRGDLEMKGRPIGAMDLLIAAHAIHERAILVTRNAGEFTRVARLKTESWRPSAS
jgi:tRNA(fMet)-specific endonuclease VapC